jgi:prepilin-type N-terminal cleavage/methylation domain-containing protein
MIKTDPKQKGFSLIEMILAIVVGASFIAGMNIIVGNYTSLGLRGRNLTLANSYSEGKAEALRSIGYNGLNNGTTDISSELPAQLNKPRSASLAISQPQDGLKRIAITVTYYDNGASRSYNYETYVGELGVGQ